VASLYYTSDSIPRANNYNVITGSLLLFFWLSSLFAIIAVCLLHRAVLTADKYCGVLQDRRFIQSTLPCLCQAEPSLIKNNLKLIALRGGIEVDVREIEYKVGK
tara:strand:- start:480 stop:791 length:312 start_codon:yes stop_codon:yes gene_type:complete